MGASGRLGSYGAPASLLCTCLPRRQTGDLVIRWLRVPHRLILREEGDPKGALHPAVGVVLYYSTCFRDRPIRADPSGVAHRGLREPHAPVVCRGDVLGPGVEGERAELRHLVVVRRVEVPDAVVEAVGEPYLPV